jgi:hypothetical protein
MLRGKISLSAAGKTFLKEHNENSIPESSTINVTINCFCRNAEISEYDGLFLTYPLMNATTDSLSVC